MKSLVFAIVAALLTTAAAPQALAASDPSTFDVAGVRLGMTAAEATAVLKPRVTKENASYQPRPAYVYCTSDWKATIAKGKTDGVAPERCISKLEVADDFTVIDAYLIEDYPKRPGVTVVYAVQYKQYGYDPAAFSARLNSRYGPPDFTADQSFYWGSDAHVMPTTSLVVNAESYPLGSYETGLLISNLPVLVGSDLEAVLGKTEATIVLSDYPAAMKRSSAIEAAYKAVVIPASPTSF